MTIFDCFTTPKHLVLLGITALFMIVVPTTSADPGWDMETLDTARDVLYLSDVEKDVILELNKVRSNPGLYAQTYLVPRRKYYNGRYFERPGAIRLITREGIRALEECISVLDRAAPVGLLGTRRGLSKSAADHASDQSGSGRTGHTGSDRSTMRQRIERYGNWDIRIGENISYGPGTGREIVVQLLVDDGVSSRGHRKNIMNPAFTLVGVGVDTHPKYNHVCVMDFAGAYSE